MTKREELYEQITSGVAPEVIEICADRAIGVAYVNSDTYSQVYGVWKDLGYQSATEMYKESLKSDFRSFDGREIDEDSNLQFEYPSVWREADLLASLFSLGVYTAKDFIENKNTDSIYFNLFEAIFDYPDASDAIAEELGFESCKDFYDYTQGDDFEYLSDELEKLEENEAEISSIFENMSADLDGDQAALSTLKWFQDGVIEKISSIK